MPAATTLPFRGGTPTPEVLALRKELQALGKQVRAHL